MAVEALCPMCGAVFSLRDDMDGKKVRCTKCEQVFTVGGEARPRPAAEKGSVQSRPAAPTKKRSRDDDEDEVTTAKKNRPAAKRGRDDDDDDDRGKAKAKKKRAYHDDDGEDDAPRKSNRKKKSGGGAGLVLGIVGGVVALLLLVCGGIGFWIYHGIHSAADDLQDQIANANANAANANVGNPAFPNVGGPGQLFIDNKIANIDEALKGLKSAQPNDRQGAARWLARQQAADAGRQAEVAKALDPLLAEPDQNSRFAAMQALRLWATTDNVPALAKALDEQKLDGAPSDANKDAMAALGRLKDERGAPAVARFLTNFFQREAAADALRQMGPVAEKAVLKYYFDKDGGVREKARVLAQGYGTKEGTIITQAVADVKQGTHRDVRRDAARWLKTARVDPAQQAAAASTLATALSDTDNEAADAAMDALDTWATADTVPVLIAQVQDVNGGRQDNMRRKAMALLGKLRDVRGAEPVAARLTNGGDRKAAGDALIAMGPIAKPAAEKYLTNSDQNVRREVERVLASYGADAGGLKLTQILADLASPEARRRSDAARALIPMRVDPAQQAKVGKALEAAAANPSDKGAEEQALRALAVWGTKDNAAALIKIVEGKDNYPANLRHLAMDDLAKWKAEDAIKAIALNIGPDGGDRAAASKALIAMGPELGAKIEAVVQVGLKGNDKAIILECVKILGAVGTKASIGPLTTLDTAAIRQKQRDVDAACKKAAAEIALRGR